MHVISRKTLIAIAIAALESLLFSGPNGLAATAIDLRKADCEHHARTKHFRNSSERLKWIKRCVAGYHRPALQMPYAPPLNEGHSIRPSPLGGLTPEVSPLRSTAPSGGLYPSGGAPGARPLGSSGAQ